MKPSEFIKKHNIELPFNLGKEIGSGVDGQVFEKQGDDGRVIKLSIKDDFNAFENAWLIYSCQPKHFVSVFDFGCLSNIIYWVEMEKLLPISEDEQRIFHTLISHEDANKQKLSSYHHGWFIMANELSEWFSLDKEKIKQFCLSIQTSPILHGDLHPRNVMKDKNGNYKLVDFDRCSVK